MTEGVVSEYDPEFIREDQVEALLKLINGRLEVVHFDQYEATIDMPNDELVGVFGVTCSFVTFTGRADTRIEAVRIAWGKCLKFARHNDKLKFLNWRSKNG